MQARKNFKTIKQQTLALLVIQRTLLQRRQQRRSPPRALDSQHMMHASATGTFYGLAGIREGGSDMMEGENGTFPEQGNADKHSFTRV